MPSESRTSAQIRVEEHLRLVTARLEQLELRVAELEAERESGFQVVYPSDSESTRPVVASPPAAESSVVLPVDRGSLVCSDRHQTLIQIGAWIRNCLLGKRRGLSGREKLPEGTTIYLVFRSVHGKLFDPVFVARKYHQITGLVKVAGECKDSVFIGLPGVEEGSIVCRAAGVTWPADWNNGS